MPQTKKTSLKSPKKAAKHGKSFEESLWDTANKLRGSGGMFVQSIKFVESHHGSKKDISVYGQEYTAAALEDDGIPSETKMTELSSTLYAQMEESSKLDTIIRENLKGLGYGQ